MVRGLFCHYLPICKDINGVYCSTTMTDTFFARYFCVVDELIVATRVYQIDTTYQEAHQEKISLNSVRIVEFPNLSTIRGVLFEMKNAEKRLYEEAQKCDLYFLRGGLIALLGRKVIKRLKRPFLVESAGCAWDEYWNYSLSGKLLAPYMEFMAKKMTKEASHVVYVTEKWLQERYPTKGISTHASNVMLQNVEISALEGRIKKIGEYEAEKKRFVIGTTGGIGNRAKGQHFVIQAMNMLQDEYDIVYELVGGGDSEFLRKICKKYNITDRVVFRGQLTHEEVLDWIKTLDLYIQPSMQEGLPRALIEAMSQACPAIGSSTGGIPELLDEKAIFKRGSVGDLAKVFRNILKDDLTIYAKMNFNKAKDYELGSISKRREDLYKKYRDFVIGRN